MLYIGITRTKVLTMNAVVMALVNVLLDYILIFGILEMEIYILGTNLFMIVETPLDFGWDFPLPYGRHFQVKVLDRQDIL